MHTAHGDGIASRQAREDRAVLTLGFLFFFFALCSYPLTSACWPILCVPLSSVLCVASGRAVVTDPESPDFDLEKFLESLDK